jgi:hypothetical protein
MAGRDDWLMSALAAQDAYRGDWPEQYGPADNPWARGVQRAADIEAAPRPRLPAAPGWAGTAREVGGRMGDLANLALETFRVPVNYASENRYPPGSEEWQQVENVKGDRAAQFGAQWALNTLGLGRLGGGVKGGVGVGGGKIVQPEGIRGYHSSPHDFERFDLSKARTGQGAQSYTPGIYIAENPAVSGQGGHYWNEFLGRFKDPEIWAAQSLQANKFDRAAALAEMRKNVEALPERGRDALWARQALDLLESGKPVGPRTYETVTKAQPEEFLAWDRPLAGQSPQTQRAIEAIDPGYFSRNYEELSRGNLGPKFKSGLMPRTFDPEIAAKVYNEAGIPGVRYLDQESRQLAQQRELLRNEAARSDALGKPDVAKVYRDQLERLKDTPVTYIHTVFDPANRLEILKKYGLAGAIPAAGAMGEFARTDTYQ